MSEFRGPTVAAVLRDGVLLIVHGDESPRDGEWESLVGFMETISIRSCVVYTGGASLNPRQRQMVMPHLKRTPFACVVTDSGVVRGVLTALRWLGGSITAFAPGEMARALEGAGVDEREIPVFRELIESLHQDLTAKVS